MPTENIFAPPCFFWSLCKRRSVMEKAGRSICRECTARPRGVEYPLRGPSPDSVYITGRSAAEALDMLEAQPRPQPPRFNPEDPLPAALPRVDVNEAAE